MFGQFFALFKTEAFHKILHAAQVSAPVWVPLLLAFTAVDLWIRYQQRRYIREKGSVLLEIKLPADVKKSPAAMEAFFTTIQEPVGAGNALKAFLLGEVRPWFSLEIVSLEGEVLFFIWCRADYQSVVEAQLYAQYPGIEVHVAPDYALAMHYDPEKIDLGWFGHLKLTKDDEVLPIKTYIDYGLDQDPKEEYKIDPMVPLLEFLGSLGKGEYGWVQILIRAHKGENIEDLRLFKRADWRGKDGKKAKEVIKKFIKDNVATLPDSGKEPTVRDLTKDMQEAVYSIERNLGKWAYDTVVRITYFAERGKKRSQNNGGLIRNFKQFGSLGLNGLKPGWYTGFKYPEFQDYKDMRKIRNNRKMFEAYKRRSIFYPPFKNFHAQPYVLTVEELATLFHFPSSEVATTPTLTRVPSKKAEAPSNLPI